MNKFRGKALTEREVRLIRISLCSAAGRLEELREELDSALERGLEGPDIREAILQVYLFSGYPRAINALGVFREVLDSREDPEASPETRSLTEEDPVELEERGRCLMRLVYGKSFERLVSNMERLDPEMSRWIVREGYGKVLSRPGLDARTRELCIVAVLRALGLNPQLEAHRKGAVNVGASEEEVAEAIELAEAFLDSPGG